MTSDVVLHDFPSPHSDFLTQFIDYRVPVEMFSAIGEYDGSCLVDRTAGEAAARCDSEAANLLTLNLMHEIITGKRTVADARETYAQNLVGYTMRRAAPYCEKFLFDVAHDGTADTDTPNAGAAMLGHPGTSRRLPPRVEGTQREVSCSDPLSDLRRARERNDPGDHVDRHAADVAAHGLDLPSVDADPRLDPGIGQRGDDGGGASKPGDRASS